ncbi:Hypothetical predicted protein [Paramuricea clavata]|uniref:Uncharacterized protein n=1 Tax=Paramuricea clavata TaxID=317549 RepID=A0A7D9E3A7_PARCT|nr:Hypothetical predicted protein [Paramuricea clavata]
MTKFILRMYRNTDFADAGVTFSHERVDGEVEVRFEDTGTEPNAIIMGVNAIPFGPPIGIIIFLTIPEDVTLGEIDNFTLDGSGFGINLGRPDGFAQTRVFPYRLYASVPTVWGTCLGYGGVTDRSWLVRTKAKTRSSYRNNLTISGIDAL